MHFKKLLFTAISLILLSCNSPQEELKADTYQVVSPLIQDMNYSHEYVAEIHSVKYVELRSRLKGYLQKIHVDEGEEVQKDQLLFTLDASEFEKDLKKAIAAHKNAIADLKAAEVELNNVKLLVEKNIISKTELDVAKAKIEALRADVEEALAKKEEEALYISFSKIRAPFSGTINRIPNKVGSLINESDMLTSISDNTEIFAYFNQSEIEYLNYVMHGEAEMKSVRLKLANHQLYEHIGKIEMIESELDPETGNIAFRARFPNPEGLLRHGASGKVVVDKPLEQALLIPQKSTFEIQDKLYVFVINAEGVAEQRNVAFQMRLDDFYVIESGLSKDEKILFEGVENIRDGAKINAVLVDLNTVMTAR